MMVGLREINLGCEEIVGSGIWEIKTHVLGSSRDMGIAMC
jgi:hypothetical protein